MNDEGHADGEIRQKRSRSYSPAARPNSDHGSKQHSSILELQSVHDQQDAPLHLDINEGPQSLSQSMMSHSQSQGTAIAAAAANKTSRASQRSNSEFHLREKQLQHYHQAVLQKQIHQQQQQQFQFMGLSQ